MKFNRLLPQGSKRREFVKGLYAKIIKEKTEEEKYNKWIKKNEPTELELLKQSKTSFSINPKISIIVPMYNTPKNFFEELLQSLKEQTYKNWELCLADGSPKKLEFIDECIKREDRIKYNFIGENKGISGNTNEALKLATGDYIGLLDHDDLLPKFSLFEIVKAINENPKVQFLYSDEDRIEEVNGQRYGAFFKPDFSPYTLNSANYICHFSVFKKELMDKLEGFNSEYDGSQDFDIVARASELTNNIVHIPKVLYHWRAHKNSTAGNSESKPYAYEIGKKVIKDHIKRSLNTEIEVKDGLTPGSYELLYKPKIQPLISIIVDARGNELEKNKKIIKNIKKSTYKNVEILLISEKEISDNEIKKETKVIINNNYNKAKRLNKAVNESKGEYFIIINQELLAIDKNNWIEQLLGIAQDENVGIVGTKLYNKDNKIEHCGIILGMNGIGDYLYKGIDKDSATYMQRLMIIHNVTCVYEEYALINRKQYDRLGGFSEQYLGKANSIDFCLKINEDNKQVIINPNVTFCTSKMVEEKVTVEQEDDLKKKWKEYFNEGDKYFSPNLSKNNIFIDFNI